VVDPRLRVHGIEHLRVADTSILPQVPGGNSNAPSIMIGDDPGGRAGGLTSPNG